MAFERSTRVQPSRIDTTFSGGPLHVTAHESDFEGPNTARFQTQVTGLPSFRVSSFPGAEFNSVPSVQSQASNSTNRTRNESRKLLFHVLNQLLNRTKPPAISDTVKEAGHGATEPSIGAFMDALRDVAKLRKIVPTSNREGYQDESDEEREQQFSTEHTFDLMLQLKDVLNITISQGWQIFEDHSNWGGEANHKDEKLSSPFRRSRSSFQSSSKRSRETSPGKEQFQVSALLSQCITILSSVISEDCRFKITSPRPSRPPNALQALTLNIAQFLIHTQRHNPAIIAQIGFAIMPAFATFQEEMIGRLLSFFEEVVVREILEGLRKSQGFTSHESLASPTSRQLDASPLVSIQIDEVQGNGFTQPPGLRLQSTSAPHQAPAIYHLSSLVAPLLAIILESIDIGSLDQDHELSRRFYRLLDPIVSLKFDAYNDLLQIVAYHGSKPRKQACALLASIWPKVIGHATISPPLFKPSASGFPGSSRQPHQGVVDVHQFVPWKFINRSRWPETPGTPQHICSSCCTGIRDFGLLCPYCMCSVHFDCYEPAGGTLIAQYSLEASADVQRVAVYRFSFVLPDGRDRHTTISIKQHNLKRINLFTLGLCNVCHQPLWGCAAQGLKCADCRLIVHPACSLSDSLLSCGNITTNSQDMTIEFKALRRSAVNHYPETRWSYEQLSMRSYEETLIFRDTLETQLRLLTNGVALGSIVIMHHGRNAADSHKVEEFELNRMLKWCEELLASQRLQCSPAIGDYMEENNLPYLEHSIMYDVSNLVYLSTAMKSPILLSQMSASNPSSDLLNVNQPDTIQGQQTESVAHPYELVPLSHLLEILQVEFNIHAPEAAKLILNHLHHLALFDRIDNNSDSFDDVIAEGHTTCIFPLPLGLDLSTDVETLVSAIEVCLLDLDLSVNEFAFLMVVRKFWPNGLMSEYGLRRLARGIISWIITEDDCLAMVLRDYVAKQKPLPGVRTPDDSPPWPFTRVSRNGADTRSSNGRDYIVVRHALLSRYAIPWLFALHNQDTEFYKQLVYDTCAELAEDRVVGPEVFDLQMSAEDHLVKRNDGILFSIIKLLQASVVFTSFEGLVLRWLRSTTESSHLNKSLTLTALNRLFPRETDPSLRLSSLIDSGGPQSVDSGSNTITVDPLRAVLNAVHHSSEDLSRSLEWLLMFARSGADISVQLFLEFSELVVAKHQGLSQVSLLIQSTVSSLWLKSMGRQNLQRLFATLHTKFYVSVIATIANGPGDQTTIALAIIRQTLAGCLLLYGCDRGSILNAGLIGEGEIRDLPSRRKLGTQASAQIDPVNVDPAVLQAIGHYLDTCVTDISCWIAKFFSIFFSDSPFIESYEIDNFILRNGRLLANCAWQFYEIQRHDLATIRTRFLLRIMVVDSEPFRDLMHGLLNANNHWERRLVVVNRLSRILTDVTSPAFDVDGRQWRSSVAEVFCCYFSALWIDPKEEIKISVRVFSSTLLPTQLEAISQCWNEFLVKSPMTDRVKMVSFLIQLRPHFPGWRVVSWDSLIETLVEFDYDAPPDGTENVRMSTYAAPSHRFPSASGTSNPDMANLLVSILTLSMQMIADGVDIDSFSLLKIKVQLIRIIGFENISVIPLQNSSAFQIQYGDAAEISELAFPCVEELVPIVDAPHSLDLPASAISNLHDHDEKNVNVLVGYVFVDVALGLVATVEELESLPVLILRSLLEAVYIILHKHDFEIQPSKGLQPLLRQAIGKIVELLLKNVSYEIRQLALTVTQAFTRRSQGPVGPIIFAIIEHVAELVVSHAHHNQDSLPLQGKTFIGSILNSHGNDGLFLNLLKRPLKPSVFLVLKQVLDLQGKESQGFSENLGDSLLRDALFRASDCDSSSFQVVINNLLSYVQVVHHEGYNYDLITYTGQQVVSLMRRISDSSFDGTDSSPLILLVATLMQNNKKHSGELLPYVETALRVALTRSSLSHTCLMSLANVVQTQLRDSSVPPGKIVAMLIEILLDGLRMKARVSPLTIKSIIECLLGSNTPVYAHDSEARLNLVSNLMENACYFLDHHLWLDSHSGNDFSASVAVAGIVLQALAHIPFAAERLQEPESEGNRRIVGSLRSWIMLALASLLDLRKGWARHLFKQFPHFVQIYVGIMRSYLQSGFGGMELATTDINHAYVAMKLWLMVACKISCVAGGDDGPVLKVWNELWPVFEGVIKALEVEAQAELSPTLIILASTSVADLLLFLRSLRTPICLEISNHLDILNQLRTARGEASTNKVLRAFRGVYEPPSDLSFDILLDQTSKEFIATEKLRAMEVRREVGRIGGERHKKDMRSAT